MKISLTKVQHSKFASEETQCFEAIVCLDGVPSMIARNDGHGGSTYFRDLAGREGSLARVDAYAKTLPEETHTFGKGEQARTYAFQPTAESLVDDVLNAHLVAKELKAKMRKATFFTIQGKDGVYRLPIAWGEEASKYLFQKYQGLATILNAIPFEQAVAIYSR